MKKFNGITWWGPSPNIYKTCLRHSSTPLHFHTFLMHVIFFISFKVFFHSTMTTVQLPCHIFFTSVLGTERKKNELVKQVLKLIARNYCSKKIMKRTDGFSVLMTSLCWFFVLLGLNSDDDMNQSIVFGTRNMKSSLCKKERT